jgi:hypothetical protein
MLNFLFDKNVTLPNSLSDYFLRGEVKEVITRFKKNKKNDFMFFDPYESENYYDLYFDTSGNLREQITYSNFNKIDGVNKYYHDLRNQLISETRESFVKIMINYEYKYRWNKIVVTSYIHPGKSEKDTKKVIRLKKDNIISVTETNNYPKIWNHREYQNGNLIKSENRFFKTIFEYDNLGKLMVEKSFGLSKSIDSIKIFNYNSNNELVSDFVTNPSGEILSTCKYLTDEQGNWISKKILNADKSVQLEVTRIINYYNLPR